MYCSKIAQNAQMYSSLSFTLLYCYGLSFHIITILSLSLNKTRINIKNQRLSGEMCVLKFFVKVIKGYLGHSQPP